MDAFDTTIPNPVLRGLAENGKRRARRLTTWQSTWDRFAAKTLGHVHTAEMAENRTNISHNGVIIQQGMEGYSMWHRSLRSQIGTHRGGILGYRGGGERFYCDGQVGVELEDNLGGISSVKPLARRVAEPRAPDTGDSCRLCDDLPKNGPELDA